MSTRLAVFLLAGCSLAAFPAAGAAPPRPVRLTLEAFGSPVVGAGGPRCGVSDAAGTARKLEAWFAIATGSSASRKGDAEIRCGPGSYAQPPPDPEKPSATLPDFVVEASAIALPAGEHALRIDVALAIREPSGFDPEHGPKTASSTPRRSFYFARDGSTFLPLAIPSGRDSEPGSAGALLRIEAGPLRDETAAAYGVVSVSSDMPGADLYLDGGRVGTVAADGETILRNVLAGDRELRARDASSREVRRVVRVVRDRTVAVALRSGDAGEAAAPYRLLPLGANSRGFEEYRRARDGAVVVKIPAGEFLMGNRNTEREPLEHRVHVSEFLMDKTGVTWGQYRRFAEATETPLPPHEPYWGIRADHPAVFVTWEEAAAYCEWAGGRLPTEAEREKAARGTDDRKYPWGNEEPDPERAVFRRSWGYAATDPVGAHPSGTSPWGLLDMAGNVWEWCADWYDEKYYEKSPPRDPKGPSTGLARVVRGGSWDSRPDVLSSSCRSWGHRGYREGDFGFRCAMDPPVGEVIDDANARDDSTR